LDLDFTQEVLDPRITFSRGSIGTRVNRNRLIETVSTNQPRFDYDPVTGECRGLLIEESRTNLWTYSDAIITSNGYSASSATLTQVTTTTPISGLTLATKVFLNVGANAGNSQNGFNFGVFSITNSTVYTQSIFVKASGSSVFRLRSNVTGQVFDIPIAGPAPAPTGTITACSVTPYPDGWSRISWTFTSTTSAPGNRGDHWAMKPNIADGSSGFLVTGAQLEAGAFPTSYIPTTASTVTRSADNASMSGTNFSSWYNSSEGSLFVVASPSTNGAYSGWIYLLGTDFNNGISYYRQSDYQPVIRIRSGQRDEYSKAINNAVGYGAIWRNAVALKSVFAFKTNDFNSFVSSVSANGSRATAGTLPTFTGPLYLGGLNDGSQKLNGTISRLTYYPRALKPNQLQLLTQ
jgi:hypothetical protein